MLVYSGLNGRKREEGKATVNILVMKAHAISALLAVHKRWALFNISLASGAHMEKQTTVAA